MICFSIPGMWGLHDNLIPFLSLYRNQPNLFLDNLQINAIHGNFYFCPWDGGRGQAYETNFNFTTEEDMYNIKNIYNNILHIPIRFILTNSIITSKYYNDKFCNTFLKICEEDYNLITINNLGLENYIRQKYPKYKFISSLTKQLSKEELLEELKLDKYFKVCFPFQYNKDFNFLKSIPVELRKKSELLVNTACLSTCIQAKQHYADESYANLHYCKNYKTYNCITYKNKELIKKQLCNTATIPYNTINWYLNNNYNNFKLDGRILIPRSEHLDLLTYYCIKPEYQRKVYNYIINLSNIKLDTYNLYNYRINNIK